MGSSRGIRRRITLAAQRRVMNPFVRLIPFQTMLETTGRKSGKPRRTPLGGRLDGQSFWIVSEFGRHSQYVKNIEADPRVRLRLAGRWRTGAAHVVDGDDARKRLASLPRINSMPCD